MTDYLDITVEQMTDMIKRAIKDGDRRMTISEWVAEHEGRLTIVEPHQTAHERRCYRLQFKDPRTLTLFKLTW